MSQADDISGAWIIEENLASVAFRVPADYLHCQGHFPGDPLVPGVTQIAWALRAVEALAGSPLPSYRISRFKFRLPIRPGAEVTVTSRRNGARFDIAVSSDGKPAASGLLVLVT